MIELITIRKHNVCHCFILVPFCTIFWCFFPKVYNVCAMNLYQNKARLFHFEVQHEMSIIQDISFL